MILITEKSLSSSHKIYNRLFSLKKIWYHNFVRFTKLENLVQTVFFFTVVTNEIVGEDKLKI